HIEHHLDVTVYHPSLYTQNAKSKMREKRIALRVALFGMPGAIDLDDELVSETSKVGDVNPDGMLLSPARPIETPLTKALPQSGSRRRWRRTKEGRRLHEAKPERRNRGRGGRGGGNAAPPRKNHADRQRARDGRGWRVRVGGQRRSGGFFRIEA